MQLIAANWQMVQKIEAEHYVISKMPHFLLLSTPRPSFSGLTFIWKIDLTQQNCFYKSTILIELTVVK